jgi:hypothetical protein
VILAALRLVEHASGSVIIKDFPGKDPRAQPDPGWRPPLDHAAVADRSAGMIASELKTEIELLRGRHDRGVTRRRAPRFTPCERPAWRAMTTG